MLQSITEYCRVLQSVTEWYRGVQSGTECYRVLQSVTECYRVLQSVIECYRVIQSVTEWYRVLQSVTECYRVFLAHLLGPIFGLVLLIFFSSFQAFRFAATGFKVCGFAGSTGKRPQSRKPIK